MAKLKVDQFVDLVKRSGLVDDDRLNQALSGIDQSVKDSGIVASSLTKAGLLTEWQSEKLLQGRHKGFYLGKYKLLNHIGTGGMGSVYLAEHRVMRHRVAIKLLPNHLAAHTSYLERFHQEARASASLNHPNMVRAHDVDHEENLHYLVMDYVDGSDLQAIVSRSGPLEYRTAADYTRQAAEGLAYAHRSGLIHRDIKPANLLVDKAGVVKILDMGLARFSDESHASLTMAYDQKMIGTVDYLAPEQALDSHKVDARADVYSLGCTLYFMLSGDAPFPQGTIPQRLMHHQKSDPADVRIARPDAPEGLLAICRKMMAKAPADRYQSAEEVAAALAAWLEEGSTTATPPPPQRYRPPSGPSQNEDLTLAPLDDEPQRGAAKTAPAPKGQGSAAKSAGSAVRGAGSSVAAGGSTASGSGAKSAGQSSIKGGSSAGRPSSASQSSVESKAAANAKGPKLSQEDEFDELLSAPPIPSTENTMSGGHATLRRCQGKEDQYFSLPMWMIIAIGLGAGAILIGLIFVLIHVTAGM